MTSAADVYSGLVDYAESPVRRMGERGNQWPTTGLGRTPCDHGEAQHQREPDS